MDRRRHGGDHALDGWSTCEIEALIEDVARWKGKRWRYQEYMDTEDAPALFILNTQGSIMCSLGPRRSAAVIALWDEILPDRFDEREG